MSLHCYSWTDFVREQRKLQDARFSRSLHHSPQGGGNAPFAPAPPARAPVRAHTPAPPPTHPYQVWTKLNFESWGYYTLAKETKQTNMNSVPIHMCNLAMHLHVVLALWIRFSIFAAKLINDRKSNNHYVLTFIISNFRIRKKLIVKNVVKSLVLFKTERSTATPAFLTPDML